LLVLRNQFQHPGISANFTPKQTPIADMGVFDFALPAAEIFLVEGWSNQDEIVFMSKLTPVFQIVLGGFGDSFIDCGGAVD